MIGKKIMVAMFAFVAAASPNSVLAAAGPASVEVRRL
jgi:hypothetical protein